MLSTYDADAIKDSEMSDGEYKTEYLAIDDDGVVAIATWSRKHNQIRFRFATGKKSISQDESMFYPIKMANISGDPYLSDFTFRHYKTYTKFFKIFFNVEGMNLRYK